LEQISAIETTQAQELVDAARESTQLNEVNLQDNVSIEKQSESYEKQAVI
jgi:hypothetical protein